METRRGIQTNAHAPPEKPARVPKKSPLGLTVGHGVMMSPCWGPRPLRCQKHSGTEALRRGRKWMGGCLPGIIEKHDFLMF